MERNFPSATATGRSESQNRLEAATGVTHKDRAATVTGTKEHDKETVLTAFGRGTAASPRPRPPVTSALSWSSP